MGINGIALQMVLPMQDMETLRKEDALMAHKILIIEDEKDIREIVAKYLEQAGFEAILASEGIDGLSKFSDFKPQLVILDVMMPIIDGFEVLRQIRLISTVPVILLTAKYEEKDRLRGFDIGADDYVVKPFSSKELVKRVEAILKRTYALPSTDENLYLPPFVLDLKQQKLFQDELEIEITTKEFSILKVFFTNPHQLLSREQLIEDAFGFDYEGFDRNIDSHIKKLRQKIELDSKNPRYLKTKYGAGYVFGGDQL